MFDLTPKQNKRVKLFIKNQNILRKKLKNEVSVSNYDETFTYSFTPTSIGVCVVIRDNLTLTMLDITDYDSW